MLSEILEAWAPQLQKQNKHAGGISASSLYPCPHRLYLVHTGEFMRQRGAFTPQQLLNMADGNDQEEQSVRRLKSAGIEIIDRQNRITIGESKVPGAYDGAFVLNNRKYLWEHKAYDQNTEAVQFVQMWGMDRLPAQRAQTNAYMLGAGLEWCDFFIKVKNNNNYIDLPYKIDRPFIDEIVNWCDKIRLEDWKPEPVECKWCRTCGVGCFGDAPDLSWIGEATDAEAVDKWIKGKQFVNIGKMMQEEADAVLIGIRNKEGGFIKKGLIGDKDVLVLPGLQISRMTSHRFDIDKSLILEEFGPEGLMKVGRGHEITSYRHKEL